MSTTPFEMDNFKLHMFYIQGRLEIFLKGARDFSEFSDEFKKLIREIPANLPAKDLAIIQEQKNRLLLAVFSDYNDKTSVGRIKDAMEFLIEAGADNFNNALVRACGVRVDTEAMLDLVKQLIQKGADIHYRDGQEQTTLRQAVYSGNILLAKYLLESGVNPNFSEQANALFSLIWGSPTKTCEPAGLELIDLLLANGVDINARDHNGRTVLQYAVWSGCHPTLIQHLQDRGADPTQIAPVKAKPSAAASVLELPAPELQKLKELYFQLKEVIQIENLEEVKKILRQNPQCIHAYGDSRLISDIVTLPFVPNKTEITDLDIEIIRELIAYGANLSYRSATGNSLLHYAVFFTKKIELVRLLLDQKPDLIQCTDEHGYTALHSACAVSKPDLGIIQLLLERGIDVNAQASGDNHLGNRLSSKGDTALHVLCQRGSEGSAPLINLLLRNNANPLLRNHERQLLPLGVAAENADLAAVETLLKRNDGNDYNDQTLKDVYCRYKVYPEWRHAFLGEPAKSKAAYEKIDRVFEAELKRRGISENLNFLSDIQSHTQKSLAFARLPRAKLKDKLVRSVLEELKKDPAKSPADLLTQTVELPKNRFTPGELKILKDNTSFSLHDALNFHRNWFGRGYTATYLKFMPNRSDLTPRDQVILFLEQIQNRLRTSSGSAKNEKRSLLNEYIQNLKKSASTLTLKEICEQRFANFGTQGPNLLQILNYKREGGKTSFYSRNETFTPKTLRKSKRPRSYSDFENEFGLKTLLDDQTICNLLNESKKIEIPTNTPK